MRNQFWAMSVFFSIAFQALTAQANPLCASCGTGPTESKSFDFAKAEQAFKSARKPEIQELAGAHFKCVGQTTFAKSFGGITNSYDPSGLKNEDGSDKFRLEFSAGSDFFGQENLDVKIYGIGAKHLNQGPYDVSLTNDKDAACFAQYAYPPRGPIITAHAFQHECRMLGSDNSKMLCGIRMIFRGNTAPNDQLRYNGQVGIYLAYVRAN